MKKQLFSAMLVAMIVATSASASESRDKYLNEVSDTSAWPSPESKYPMYPTPEVGKYPAWPDSKG